MEGCGLLVYASANYKAVAFHIKRWDLEKQSEMHLVITRQVVIGSFIQRTGSASVTAACTIASQGAAAPATLSTSGGRAAPAFTQKLPQTQRTFNRKHFKLKFLL